MRVIREEAKKLRRTVRPPEAYARLAERLSRTLKRRRSSQAVNGAVGAILVGLGSRLALAPH